RAAMSSGRLMVVNTSLAAATCGSDSSMISAPHPAKSCRAASIHLTTTASASSNSGVNRPRRKPVRHASFGIGWSVSAAVINAAACADAERGPTESKVRDNGKTPSSGHSPVVDFTPTTPQNAAGPRIEPPVSDPMLKVHSPAATATAEPLEEPDASRIWCASHGLRGVPFEELIQLFPSDAVT